MYSIPKKNPTDIAVEYYPTFGCILDPSVSSHRYVVIFMSVKSSVEKMGAQSTAETDEYALAKKLMLIVATDLACWVSNSRPTL